MKGMDLAGQKYGRLLVKSYSHSKNGKFWNCICDCGGIAVISTSHLRQGGGRVSCGCLNREIASDLGKKEGPKRKRHGLNGSKLKTCYDNMFKRCYVETSSRYDRYGGRGIEICAEWLEDRINFYNWALSSGYEEGLSIERIDVDGNYCPENCKWIDASRQQANTSRNIFFVWKGVKRHLAEICRLEGISYQAVIKRLARGWSIEDAANKNLGRLK